MKHLLFASAGVILLVSLGCGGGVSSTNGTGSGGAPTTSVTTGSSTTSGSTSTTTTTASTSGTGGATPCASDQDCAPNGLSCCGGVCVNTRNDLDNCGACGVTCDGAAQFCDGAKCATPMCNVATQCANLCCFAECCAPGEICCEVQKAGPSQGPKCTDPTPGGTCPVGCPLCK